MVDRRHVAGLAVGFHVAEPRKGVPDAGNVRDLLALCADHGVVFAIRLGAVGKVVSPADVVLVEQVGQIGPGVGIRVRRGGQPRVLERGSATHGVARVAAFGGPTRNHEQVRRQAPRCVWFEHVVLEDVVARPGPVVGDFALVHVAHDVGRAGACAGRIKQGGATLFGVLGLADEAGHRSAGDVRGGVRLAVRTTGVGVGRHVERRVAAARGWVRDAHRRSAVVHGNAVGTRISTEIRVERAVLLHDHDHMLDDVDRAGDRGRGQR